MTAQPAGLFLYDLPNHTLLPFNSTDAIDTDPTATRTTSAGIVDVPVVSAPFIAQDDFRGVAFWAVTVTFTVHGLAPDAGLWQVYAFANSDHGPHVELGFTGLDLGARGGILDSFSAPAGQTRSITLGVGGPYGSDDWLHVGPSAGSLLPADGVPLLGVGIYLDSLSGAFAANQIPNEPTATDGRWGITDKSQASFYWGTKIANTLADDRDKPLGPTP